MRKTAPFPITGKLQCIGAENGFKQVETAYVAANCYFDKIEVFSEDIPRAVLWYKRTLRCFFNSFQYRDVMNGFHIYSA